MGIISTLCESDVVEAGQGTPAATPASPLDCALDYISRGYAPIPVPYRSKKPILEGWQHVRITADTAPEHFVKAATNIGLIMGAASSDLADIDIDCPEALATADRFLPATESMFGRRSKPRSHRLYLASGARTKQFKDPLTQTMLVELRASGGHQTVVPGSTHESGEPVEWHVDGTPSAIGADLLLAAVSRVAAASLVVRYLGTDAIEQRVQNWPGMLDACDPKLGDAARRWLGVREEPDGTPAKAPDSLELIQNPGFEHSEQIEHGAAPVKFGGSTLSTILQADQRRRYAEQALANEAAQVTAAQPGGQKTTLFSAAARMGEFVGAGVIEEAVVTAALTRATVGWPTDPEKGPWYSHQIERAIVDGIRKGTTKPRDLSKIGDARAIAPSAPETVISVTIPEWPTPDLRLVDDDRPLAPALEDDALPAGWSEWIKAEAEARGCPSDYVAAGLIGFASAWVGNARHVAAIPGWSEPPHLWLVQIGGPSMGKSPSLRPFIDATRVIEREAEPAWRADLAQHAALAAAAEITEESWRESVRTATVQNKPPPDRPAHADAPPPPPRPRLVAMDATTEELQYLLASQPRGLLYMRDELAGWLGNLDRYGGKGGDRAFYLESYNGGEYVVDRVKNKGVPLRIARTSLAIVGGMQPDKLRAALEGPDDGLAARLIYIDPAPAPITSLVSDDAHAIGRQERLLNAARRLRGLEMHSNPSGEPTPRILRLDPAAFALIDEMRRDAMQRAREARGLAAGWHGKNPGRALRLGLNFQLLAWVTGNGAEPGTITADAMARAGGYLDYAAAMLDRVTAGLAISDVDKNAAVIARHLLATHASRFNERELYQQAQWAWLRDNGSRAAALAALHRAGWIRPAQAAGKGRPRGDWDVSPRLWEHR